jgi:GGDEF domain-containing protein
VLADLTERKHAEMMRDLAEHDALTGLPNRRRRHELLRRSLAAARRYPSGLALHMLDLDGFKPAKDRLGHAGGDEALREAAQRIRAQLREEDLLARLGELPARRIEPGRGDAGLAAVTAKVDRHVIVAGFGRAGRTESRAAIRAMLAPKRKGLG